MATTSVWKRAHLLQPYVLHRQNLEKCNEDDEQLCLLTLPLASSIKRVTKGELKKAKSHHNAKMMLSRELHKEVMNFPTRNVAWDFKNQSLHNALVINVSRNCEKVRI